jgi:rhodanese-related sulfurtransferase
MKKMLVVMCSLFAASTAFANGPNASTIECASKKGHSPSMPPGCFAKAAQNAEDTFSVTKGGGQMLTPAAVHGWQDGSVTPPRPYVVIDVRPTTMYAAGHVPGAGNVPLDGFFLPENLVQLPTDGQTSIVLVCQSGHTASMALGALVALGYDSVYVITGGTLAWQNAGYPLEQ